MGLPTNNGGKGGKKKNPWETDSDESNWNNRFIKNIAKSRCKLEFLHSKDRVVNSRSKIFLKGRA